MPKAIDKWVFHLEKICDDGKTYLATSLAICAYRQGKKVHFYVASGHINDLLEAQSQLRLNKLEVTLAKFDLIILDELDFVPFIKDGAEALFTFCAYLHEQGSLMITTNLEFGRWKENFGDEALTGAFLDRLTHRRHILEMKVDSYRFKESPRKKKDFELSYILPKVAPHFTCQRQIAEYLFVSQLCRYILSTIFDIRNAFPEFVACQTNGRTDYTDRTNGFAIATPYNRSNTPDTQIIFLVIESNTLSFNIYQVTVQIIEICDRIRRKSF